MTTRPVGHDHDQLLELLEICQDFITRTSPATRHELDTLLCARGITGGPGWLIDMLALTHRHLQTPTQHDEPGSRPDT
jgi:hypothetical protein